MKKSDWKAAWEDAEYISGYFRECGEPGPDMIDRLSARARRLLDRLILMRKEAQ